MMNTFQIGNFKAFSDLQTIPLKPITVIFGPNSSGKSSVIHSLLLARHGVDTESLDATYPSIAGQSVDLGGFRQFIHRRNLENRLQWSAEMSINSLPVNLARDLAKADLLTVHLTAGIELDDHGQPVPGAAPFTQTCEYRIDGEPFIRLARTERRGDFLLSQLNREHAVFEPILQAMLLSSRSQQSLTAEDSELLAKLIDTIVPQIRFQGDSDFLPGTEFDPDLLGQMDRALSKGEDAGEFGKLGDLGRSVRLFLPRTLFRFHAGVLEALTQSLESLTYLGPLRSFPPRHMAFAEQEAFGHAAAGALAWQELAVNDEVRQQVNAWLSNESKLRTPYRLEIESFYSQQAISDMVAELQEDIANYSIQDFLRGLPEESDFLERYRNFAVDPDSDWAFGELDTELASLVGDVADLEEAFKNYVAPRLADLLAQRTEPGAADVRLYDIQKRTPVSHRDVGIGVSQVLPVLVQAYASRNKLIAMEQPEIHLHPALQAELGDVFIESALGESQNRFILETHSEHLILRILRRIRESAKDPNPAIRASDVAVLYVEPSPEGAEVYEMEISEEGQILSQWPGGFFPERMKEMFGEI